MQVAKGKFDISMQTKEDPDHPMGRMVFDKVFSGDLSGKSAGQMLSHRTQIAGSAGYVALEKAHATLDGKTGSFILQHLGVMNHGNQSLKINIVPDSGTEGFVGITGSMEIKIEDHEHFYTFGYYFENEQEPEN